MLTLTQLDARIPRRLPAQSANIVAAIRNAYNAVSLSVTGTFTVAAVGGAAVLGPGLKPIEASLTLTKCPGKSVAGKNSCGSLKDKDVVQYSLQITVPKDVKLPPGVAETTIAVQLLGCTTLTFKIKLSGAGWVPDPWPACPCGGQIARSVVCKDSYTNTIVADSECTAANKPAIAKICPEAERPTTGCYVWNNDPWPSCPCSGLLARAVVCRATFGAKTVVLDVKCAAAGPRPTDSMKCVPPVSVACLPSLNISPLLDCIAGGSKVVVERELATGNSSVSLSASTIPGTAAATAAASATIVCIFGGGTSSSPLFEVAGTAQHENRIVAGAGGKQVVVHTCIVPAYAVPTEWKATSESVHTRGGSGDEWKVPLKVKVDGTLHIKDFSFTYQPCCLIPPPFPFWPLILFLPFVMGTFVVGACSIYMRSLGRMTAPPLQFVDAVQRPKTPAVQIESKTIEMTVKKPYKAPPKKIPPKKVKKKKWDTVTAGTYLRNGAHVETNWGKFGEAGGGNGQGDDESESEKSESEEEEIAEKPVLHQAIEFKVNVPAPLDLQMLQLDLPVAGAGGPASPTTAISTALKAGKRQGAPCPWGQILTMLISGLCCVGAIAAIIMLNIAYATLATSSSATCATSNRTEFCPSVKTCAACNAAGACTWCGSSCLATRSSAVTPLDTSARTGGSTNTATGWATVASGAVCGSSWNIPELIDTPSSGVKNFGPKTLGACKQACVDLGAECGAISHGNGATDRLIQSCFLHRTQTLTGRTYQITGYTCLHRVHKVIASVCGAPVCPPESVSNGVLAGLSFVLFILFIAIMVVVRCAMVARRRRGQTHLGDGGVAAPPAGGGKKKRAEARRQEKQAKKLAKKQEQQQKKTKKQNDKDVAHIELYSTDSPSAAAADAAADAAAASASLWPAPKDSDPLAAGWDVYTDPQSQVPFYRNAISGEVTWSKPVQTPHGGAGGTFDFATANPMYDNDAGQISSPVAEADTLNGMPITDRLEGGWVELWDESTNGYFYGHPETGTTTWDKPSQSTGVDMVLSPRAHSNTTAF